MRADSVIELLLEQRHSLEFFATTAIAYKRPLRNKLMKNSIALVQSISPPSVDKLEIVGTGLHSGRRFKLSLLKSAASSGLIFKAKTGEHECSAPALWTRLSGTTRSTALVLRGPHSKAELRTVEHLLAALYVLGLQNFEISIEEVPSEKSSELKSEYLEIPVLDGSSYEWMNWLWELAEYELSVKQELKAYRIIKNFRFDDGERFVEFSPLAASSTHMELDVFVDFGPELEQRSRYSHNWAAPQASRQDFFKNFAPARTFGFSHEVEALRARGLALGGSLDNAILIDGHHVVNQGGFRVPNELSAHKLVDAVGDFSLLGQALIGSVRCSKAGHALHVRALKEAFDEGVFEPCVITVSPENS